MQAHLSWQRSDDKDESGLSPHQLQAFCPDIIFYIHLQHQPLRFRVIELHHTAKIVICHGQNSVVATICPGNRKDQPRNRNSTARGRFNAFPIIETCDIPKSPTNKAQALSAAEGNKRRNKT